MSTKNNSTNLLLLGGAGVGLYLLINKKKESSNETESMQTISEKLPNQVEPEKAPEYTDEDSYNPQKAMLQESDENEDEQGDDTGSDYTLPSGQYSSGSAKTSNPIKPSRTSGNTPRPTMRSGATPIRPTMRSGVAPIRPTMRSGNAPMVMQNTRPTMRSGNAPMMQNNPRPNVRGRQIATAVGTGLLAITPILIAYLTNRRARIKKDGNNRASIQFDMQQAKIGASNAGNMVATNVSNNMMRQNATRNMGKMVANSMTSRIQKRNGARNAGSIVARNSYKATPTKQSSAGRMMGSYASMYAKR